MKTEVADYFSCLKKAFLWHSHLN